MFRFDEGLKVYLHRDPVDFRMGINGLSATTSPDPPIPCIYMYTISERPASARDTHSVR